MKFLDNWRKKKMKKQVKLVFGKKYYLLGINNEGEKEWLE